MSSGASLPAIAETNVSDVYIFTKAVASRLIWVDISNPNTLLTSAEAGDIGLFITSVLVSGWVRVGNIVTGDARILSRLTALDERVDTNVGRLGVLDRQTADLDHTVEFHTRHAEHVCDGSCIHDSRPGWYAGNRHHGRAIRPCQSRWLGNVDTGRALWGG